MFGFFNISFSFSEISMVTSVMNESVTVERDGWSRQDSSLFDRVSQRCSSK